MVAVHSAGQRHTVNIYCNYGVIDNHLKMTNSPRRQLDRPIQTYIHNCKPRIIRHTIEFNALLTHIEYVPIGFASFRIVIN